MFAVHGRLRPYNRWLEWELEQHPLPVDVPLAQLERIARSADVGEQRALFRDAEAIAREHGLGAVIDSWEPDVAWLRKGTPDGAAAAGRAASSRLLLEHAARLRDAARDDVGSGQPRGGDAPAVRVEAVADARDDREDDLDDDEDRELGVAGHGQDRAVDGSAAEAGVARLGRVRWGVAVAAPEAWSTSFSFSGREGRDMEELELQAVRVVEEDGVVARRVRVFLRLALEQRAVLRATTPRARRRRRAT